MKHQKKVLAINDISCIGKCSLTVALPVISAAGAEVDVIPTAVLATQTGGFQGYTFRDLTEDIPAIGRHWKTLPLCFDAIYTGYLGSFRQLAIVSDLIEKFRDRHTLVCVDPVMGDAGKLYDSFQPNFPEGMARLCAKADLILPNPTEAALLLGKKYRPGPYSRAETADTLRQLSALGPKQAVLTGFWEEPGQIGCAVYHAGTDSVRYVLNKRVEGFYHGTGDVLASALVGALMNGIPLARAAQIAVNFTAGSVRRTHDAGTDPRLGVNFEAGLPGYIKALRLCEAEVPAGKEKLT